MKHSLIYFFLVYLCTSALSTNLSANTWISNLTEDPMSDEPRGTVTYTDSAAEKLIVVRCGTSYDYDGLDIIIAWKEYFSDDDKWFKYRFDKNEPITTRMSLSTSNDSFFVLDDEEQRFLASMKASGRLVMQTQPYNEGTQTWIVSLNGFTNAWNTHCKNLVEPQWQAKAAANAAKQAAQAQALNERLDKLGLEGLDLQVRDSDAQACQQAKWNLKGIIQAGFTPKQENFKGAHQRMLDTCGMN